MNFEFSINNYRNGRAFAASFLCLTLAMSLALSSCSKNPEQLQELGMKAYSAGEYAKALEYFSDGIKKEGTKELYAGFIAANLMTGKYPRVNSAYNTFCEDIHASLVAHYGKRFFLALGVTTELTPYKINGANDLPADYPQTIVLQESADFGGYLALKGQIDSILRK